MLPAKPLKPDIVYLKSILAAIEAVKSSSACVVTSPLSFTMYFPATAFLLSTSINGAANAEDSRTRNSGVYMSQYDLDRGVGTSGKDFEERAKDRMFLVELYLHQRQNCVLNTNVVEHAQVPEATDFFDSQ
jgi:hypothetical protein